MKKLILTIMMLIISTASSHALTYYFSGSDAGGTGSATMDITTNLATNTLTLTLDNTSPTTLDGGTGVNSPGITGFGFNLDPDVSMTSWELTADTSIGAPVTIGTIGSSGGATPWILGTTQSGVTMDFLNFISNVQGALYNPLVTDGLAAPPNYFTTATLTMVFNGDPIIDSTPDGIGSGLTSSTYVRFQNVGLNGEGSLKLTGNPVPEPGTVVLLGIGLFGLAIFGKRRMNSTEA